MRLRVTWWLLVAACGWPFVAGAQLRLLPGQESQRVFAGDARTIHLVVANAGGNDFDAEICARIFQASSATAIHVGEKPWKRLQILPGQTVLESVTLDFPAVKAETKFLVQWLENSNRVIGTTEVWVYPTNLLAEVKPLLDGEVLGVLDPNNELTPTLKQNGVRFVDLGQAALEDFSGRLAILGPFHSKIQMPAELTRQVKVLAKKNVAVIWLLPPPDKQDQLLPSFYTVMEGTNAVIVAQADMVSNLSVNPQSQLHLIHFCKLALRSEPLGLPDLTTQP